MPARSFFLAVLTTFYAAFLFGLLLVLDLRPISESREQFSYFFSLTVIMAAAWLLATWVFKRFPDEAIKSHFVLLSVWLSFSLWTARVSGSYWTLLSLGIGIFLITLSLTLYGKFSQTKLMVATIAAFVLLFVLNQAFAFNYFFVTTLLIALLAIYLRFSQEFLAVSAAALGIGLAVFLPIPGSTLIFAWIFAIGSAVFVVYAIGMAGFVEKLTSQYSFHSASNSKRLIADIIAVVVILVLSFDLSLNYDTFHFSPYLTTINDVLHGRSVLVDTFSIYGASLSYFLALPFSLNLLPFNFHSFSLVHGLMSCAELLLVYLIMRCLTRSIRWSFLATLLIIVFHLYLTASNRLNVAVMPLPQTGVLRYGGLYMLIAFAALRWANPKASSLFRGLEYLLIAVIATWSIEAILFVIPAYIGMLAYELLQSHADNWRKGIVLFMGRFALVILMMILGILGFTLFTYLRSGQLPQLSVYLNYILTLGYQNQNYQSTSNFLVPFWSAWAFPVLVYILWLSAVAHFYFRKDYRFPAPLVGLLFGGVIGFYYWVGNSTILGGQIIIPLMLLSYGLFLMQKQASLRRIFNIAAIAGLLIIPFYYILQKNYPFYSLPTLLISQARGVETPAILPIHRNELVYQSAFLDGSLIHRDELAEDVIHLVEAHFSPDEPLILFVQNESLVVSLLYLGRVQLFSLTGEFEDSINETALERALQRNQVYLEQIELGQHIVTMRDWDEIGTTIEDNPLPRSITESLLKRICERFGVRELERMESGMVALELVPLSPETACEAYWEMD